MGPVQRAVSGDLDGRGTYVRCSNRKYLCSHTCVSLATWMEEVRFSRLFRFSHTREGVDVDVGRDGDGDGDGDIDRDGDIYVYSPRRQPGWKWHCHAPVVFIKDK